MLEEELLSRVRDFARNNSENDDIHGFSHSERVYELSIKIGKDLGADLLILKLSALLHDIGRKGEKKFNSKNNHAQVSAQMALKFLKKKELEMSEKTISKVVHCIRAHSYSHKTVPETLEAKILSDVDKLDALGAIGLYRTIGFTIKKQGGLDQVIEHLENKILKLKDGLFLDISKNIAKDREVIIRDFYKKIAKQK